MNRKTRHLTVETLPRRAGDYIIYNRLGTPCLRRLPKNFHPESHFTEAHRVNQDRIRYLVSLYQALEGTKARESWRDAPKQAGQTGYNAFVSRNYAAFDAEEAVADHARLVLADGELRHPLDLRVAAAGDGRLVLEWDTSDDRLLGAADDLPRLILMPDDGSYGIIARETLDARRGDGRAAVTLAPEEGRPPFAYVFWESSDGRRFSPSLFLPVAWADTDGL